VIGMESAKPHIQVRKLARFGLTTPNAYQLAQFYQKILDFRLLRTERRSGTEFERLMGADGGASAITLGLGNEIVELLQFDQPGRLYPKDAASSDLRFQHVAIVVADIHLAYQKLISADGWMAISIDGPQQLPTSSGGVTAFKFRDPDGHPLELLAFPEGRIPPYWEARSQGNLFLGIDHSAISVSDSATSITFYEGLGLRVAARSLNVGQEQERLDAVRQAQVEVTALEFEQTPPHVELLCYRSTTRVESAIVCNNDVAATRLVFDVCGSSLGITTSQELIDPDGHRLLIPPAFDRRLPIELLANAGSSPTFAKPE
jgi:catechol 2,3-dioxygenase-like lactoylglutathione lyase family enzyme